MRIENGHFQSNILSFYAGCIYGSQNSINNIDEYFLKKIRSSIESISSEDELSKLFDDFNEINNLKEHLMKYNKINDILDFGINYIISFPTEIKERIKYLLNCADEELKNENFNKEEQKLITNNLKNSLINCFCFLICLKHFNEPIITLHPDFLFALEWELSKNNCIILQFYPENKIQYLFFTPNNNLENNRNVIQGFTDTYEIFNLLDNLKLNSYKN